MEEHHILTAPFVIATRPSFFLLSIFLVVATVLSVCLLSNRFGTKGKRQFLPGIPEVPGRHWLLGHVNYPYKGADQPTKQKAMCFDNADSKTGLCTLYVFTLPIVSVSKPKDIQKILQLVTNKGSVAFFQRLSEKYFGKNNVAVINGREWKIHRAPISRALQSLSALHAAQYHILRVGETLVESINKKIEQSGKDQQTNLCVVPLMKMATFDVFSSAALGRDVGCCRDMKPSDVAVAFDFLGADLRRRTETFFSIATHLFWIPTEANKRFTKEKSILREFLRDTISSRMERLRVASQESVLKKEAAERDWEINQNLLSQMIKMNSDCDKADEGHLDLEGFVNSMIVLLFAGYDTTANALSFALHQVATNAETEANCVEEAIRVLGEIEQKQKDIAPSSPERLDVLNRFPYCHAVFQESLRLYPPAVSTARVLDKDVVLGSVVIPKGTMIVIPIYCVHHDERNFPNPEAFLPERWVRRTSEGGWESRGPRKREGILDDDLDLPEVANRDAFLPFSSGVRNCAGRRFALQEGVLLLAVLVRKLKFQVVNNYSMKPVHVGLLMSPSEELPMIISTRG